MSVVIPAYNAESYLPDAIESVLSQGYDSIECIVVDDGSTDGTSRVLDRYRNRIRSVSQTNAGVSAARNLGISAAEGELVAFLDADDVWAPDKLNRQIPLFREEPDLIFSYGGIELVDTLTNRLGTVRAHPTAEAVEHTLTLRPGGFHLAMTGVVLKEALVHVGAFDTRLSTSADADLALRLADLGRGEPVDGVLARYRQHTFQMHLDPAVFEHDWRIVLERTSSLSSLTHRPGLMRRAWAEFDWMVGVEHWKAGKARTGPQAWSHVAGATSAGGAESHGNPP